MPVLTCFSCKTHDGAYMVFSIPGASPKTCPQCHGSNVAVSERFTGAERSYDAKGRRFNPCSKDKPRP